MLYSEKWPKTVPNLFRALYLAVNAAGGDQMVSRLLFSLVVTNSISPQLFFNALGAISEALRNHSEWMPPATEQLQTLLASSDTSRNITDLACSNSRL